MDECDGPVIKSRCSLREDSSEFSSELRSGRRVLLLSLSLEYPAIHAQ